MSLLIFIAILVVLILVHEVGHLVVAKLFNIKVSEFNIGFPPRLFSVRWGETRYSFSALLVGGYVNIFGENGEDGKGDPRSMASKPRLVQAAVVVAGVAMNIALAWLILSAGYLTGMPAQYDQTKAQYFTDVQVSIVSVLPGSPAAEAGITPGDAIQKIASASGEVLEPAVGGSGESVQQFIERHQDESMIFSVARGDETLNLLAKPVEGIVEGKKVVGIEMADIGTLRLPAHLSLLEGAISTKQLTIGTAKGLGSFFGRLAMGEANWNEVAGPVGIAGAGAGAVREGFATAAFLTALISINLAIINLLPIPGLDGGRLLILAIEGIIRRPVSPKVVTALSLAGFALILTLMVVVTYHDITKLIG
jgi:regulator of sigma E protease